MTEREKIERALLIVIGNKTRSEITQYVIEKKRTTFGEIMKSLNLASGNLSYHLGKLKEAQIIAQLRNRGPYRLDEYGEMIKSLSKAMKETIEDIVREHCKTELNKKHK